MFVYVNSNFYRRNQRNRSEGRICFIRSMLQRLTSKKIQRCGCCTGTVERDKTSVKQVEEIFRDKANDVEETKRKRRWWRFEKDIAATKESGDGERNRSRKRDR